MPLRLTSAELLARVPALCGPTFARAWVAGLIQTEGDDFLVRSPALLALVADGAAAGIPITDMLSLAAALREKLSSLAEIIADLIAGRVLPALQAGQNAGELVALLQRGRPLLLQGAPSLLAGTLAAALLHRSAGAHRVAGLRGPI